MTACAPLCGPDGVQRVTSRRSPQTQPCPKRVAGVYHPTNSAQPKVAGEPGGRKMCRIKAGGRLRVPRPATPPRRAGRGFSIGGRNFHFLLWQVTDIRKFRKKTAVFRHSIRWLSQVVFWHFTGISAGVSFHPLGSSRGSVFPLLLQPPQYWRVQAGIFVNVRRSVVPQEKQVHAANLPLGTATRQRDVSSEQRPSALQAGGGAGYGDERAGGWDGDS